MSRLKLEANRRAQEGSTSAMTTTMSAIPNVSLSESVQRDEAIKELHDAVELDLVRKTCKWSRLVLICGAGAASITGYLSGEEMNLVINPLLLTIFGLCTSLLCENLLTQMTFYIGSYILAILRHSLYQGCSASLVPVIYGFIPCACGFLFRTPRAVLVSTGGVLAATAFIFAVDLSGNCVSEPIAPHQKGIIFSERFLPLVVLIVGNSAVLVAIVRQSQNSLLVHAKASRSAAKLADIRRDVLHRVTHELRTPLNGIVGSVDLLVNSETMCQMDMENARTIKTCLDSILGICDDVLMAAKQDRATQEAPFRLASCVDSVAEIFAASTEARGIKLKVEFVGDTTVVVRGMAIKLRQVLLNLVGNALKFTETGSITIRVKTQEEQDPASSNDVLSCLFEVEDTGVGVEGQDSEMLFEPFHQGESGGAVSRRHKGTGLGLTICRDLVDLMGGKIAVTGVCGQGTRFYFTLKLQKENPIAADSGIFNGRPPPPCRIVIADSQKESSASCQSLVRSIAPLSADVSLVQSSTELMDIIGNEKDVSAETRRVAFLEFDPRESGFLSILSQLNQSGWMLFVYCEYGVFPILLANSKDAHAVFRRPLQLVRMGDALRDALVGTVPSAVTARGFITTASESPCNGAMKCRPEVDSSTQDASVVSVETGPNETCCGDRTVDATTQALSTGGEMAQNGNKRKADMLGSIEKNERNTKKEKFGGSMRSSFVGTPFSRKRRASTAGLDATVPGSKVVVVDDTPVNVKVMVKMLSRSTSLPIVSLSDGQSAIELVKSSDREDLILFLMDWHMPGVCGLTATKSIRRIAQERGGPRVYICMVTADIEGLTTEMERQHMTSEGTVSKDGVSSSKLTPRRKTRKNLEDEFTVLDIVAGKPVTFQSIQAILTWFQEQVSS